MTIGGSKRRSELEERLKTVEESFAREMRERGFELDQAENVALPGPLAKLYAEREELRAELEEITQAESNRTTL